MLAGMMLLSGCAIGGILKRAETDTSLFTSSVEKPDPEKASDQATIRNAVSSANLEELQGGPIPWANLDTGSRGAVSAVTEYRESGTLCRKFTASRESFEGIGLFRGDACLRDGGYWWMRSFDAS